MKILWLYKYSDKYNFDHWFHMDFVKSMRNNGVDIWAYGPELHVEYSELCISQYYKNINLSHIYELFNFDVIVLNTKSRMFDYYNPHTDESRDCWLPMDLNYYPKPKVVLEEDYHYEKNDNWYKEIRSSLVIQRHFNNYKIQKERGQVKTFWLPFSVDTDIFKPNYSINRKNLICFSGNKPAHVYPFRHKACEILKTAGISTFIDFDKDVPDSLRYSNNNIIKDFDCKMKEQDYIKCLQDYVCHLNGSSIYNVTPAKMFEIMSSGSVLFTNENDEYGLKELFDEESYVTYKEDFSDIVIKANRIIKDTSYTKQVAEKGLKCIKERHTKEIRIKEMLNLFRKEL